MIPKVNGQQQHKSGVYILPQVFTVELDCFAPWCLEAFCQRTGRVCEPANRNGDMRLIHNTTVTEEGYRLTVSETGIEIHASSERGVVWALTTVYAVMEEDGTIPCCAVSDCPRYSYRGVMLDCVRHFFDAQEVKRVIEEMSLVKLNVLHWHLSNDQGFRVESKKFPDLCQQPDNPYYTQEEIRDVVEYARVRGVEIIPERPPPPLCSGFQWRPHT